MNIQNLSIWYNQENKIIKSANIDLGNNSVNGLLGINGAGKTTLFNTIAGIHKKYSIDKLYFDNQLTSFNSKPFMINRYVVFTNQSGFTYWNFSTYIKFIEKIYEIASNDNFLKELIYGFNFQNYIDIEIGKLSTGNKKKVFLITGFYIKRRLLILDEPFDGLDFQSTEYLYELIGNYKKKGTILMSSHIQESFNRTCDSVLVLKNSNVRQFDFSEILDLKVFLNDGV